MQNFMLITDMAIKTKADIILTKKILSCLVVISLNICLFFSHCDQKQKFLLLKSRHLLHTVHDLLEHFRKRIKIVKKNKKNRQTRGKSVNII